MLRMSYVFSNYILYACPNSTKSQDLIKLIEKGTGIHHFHLNKYCLILEKLDQIATISVIIASCSFYCSYHYVEISQKSKHNMYIVRNLVVYKDKLPQPIIPTTSIFHWFSICFQHQFKNLAIVFKALLSKMHPRLILCSLHNETAVSLQATLASVKLTRLKIKCSQLMAVICWKRHITGNKQGSQSDSPTLRK